MSNYSPRHVARWTLSLAMVITLAGILSSCSNDPNRRYRDIQLTKGMGIATIKEQLGEPDSYEDAYCDDRLYLPWGGRTRDREHPYYVQQLDYGPFGAHSQRVGHITKYRVKMKFVDEKLHEWSKSAPGPEE